MLLPSQTLTRLSSPPPPKHTILLTGATGFLAKVVLEELFRLHASDIEKVILLVRPKKGHDPLTRFRTNIASSPCFSKLPPGWINSVSVIEGDLTAPGCGINDETYTDICKEITHIIHCAAAVSFELSLADAVTANVTTASNILDFAADCPNLKRLVDTSTAYVTHRQGPIFEELAPLPYPASEVLLDIEHGKLSDAEILQACGHPNTYTLTKCIAEHLVAERRAPFPITIARPSIICVARRYPMPGWVDSVAALTGAAAAFGTGLMKAFVADPSTRLDVVPVDDVAQNLIAEAFAPTHPQPPLRIVHLVATVKNNLVIGPMAHGIVDCFRQMPGGEKAQLVYVGHKGWRYSCYDCLYHQLPTLIGKFYCDVRGKAGLKRTLEKGVQMRGVLQRTLPHFSVSSYDFRCENEMLGKFDWEGYVRTICHGTDEFILKKVRERSSSRSSRSSSEKSSKAESV